MEKRPTRHNNMSRERDLPTFPSNCLYCREGAAVWNVASVFVSYRLPHRCRSLLLLISLQLVHVVHNGSYVRTKRHNQGEDFSIASFFCKVPEKRLWRNILSHSVSHAFGRGLIRGKVLCICVAPPSSVTIPSTQHTLKAECCKPRCSLPYIVHVKICVIREKDPYIKMYAEISIDGGCVCWWQVGAL